MAPRVKKQTQKLHVPRIKKHREIKNVINIGDTHSGCKLALCHPDGAELDDGGVYLPSKVQLKLWDFWEEFWGEIVPKWTKKEPFAVVHLGDDIDGVHHGSTTQWSHNLEDQGNHAYKLLKPVVDLCEGRYYHIRGTEAHVGKSGVESERIARRLGAIPNDEGQHSRWEMYLRIGTELVHYSHHIGTTGSAQHETSALNAEYAAICMDCARWGWEPPSILARGHRHMSSGIELPKQVGMAKVFVTPCWQLKTPFAYRTKAGRVNTPQVGGGLIRMGDEEVFVRIKVWPIERPREVVLSV